MRFEEAYEGWTSTRLTQIDAARLLGEGGRPPPAGPGGALCAGCCDCAPRGVVASTESFRA